MKTTGAAFSMAVVAGSVAIFGARCAPAEGPGLAVVGATVIDGTGSAPQVNATILIRGGRIEAIGPASEIEVRPGSRVIDAGGKYVIPGLADMHVHFGPGGPVAADVDRLLRQFLFYGVTTVLNVGATGGDLATIGRLRTAIDSGTQQGPTIYASGGLITVPGSHPTSTIMRAPPSGDWSEVGVWVVDDENEMRATVQKVAQAGMDAVKIIVESGPAIYGDEHPQMSPELVAAAVDESRRQRLPILAHATSPDELETVVDAGVNAVMHLVAGADSALLARMARKGIYCVPTLGLFVWPDTWGDPKDNLTDPFIRAGVENRVIESLEKSGMLPKAAPAASDLTWRREFLSNLARAREAGITVVAGTDTGNPLVFPGFSMHHELELMVEAGMSPMDALVAATRLPAQMLGKSDVFGTLQPGRRADLLVLGANPLEDIRNTRSLELVVQKGVVLDRAILLDGG
jgi:imidazolonepropionase-like amidohydrolase